MSGAAVKQSPAAPDAEAAETIVLDEQTLDARRKRQAATLRLLWNCRALFLRVGAIGLLASTLLAFMIPKEYTSTAELMPPDTRSTSGLAMMEALAGRAGDGLGSVAGDLLGLKNSGELFVGVLRSETAEDRIIDEFNLKEVYGKGLLVDARKKLDEETTISEDRKSGIISISVTDHSAKRAAAIANAYVDELNVLMADLSTSSAHRERVFLEGRLKVVKQELDDATNALAQFSSKNNTLDIQTEGKAMLDAAGTLAGQLIAAQSELEGLRQIYTDNNPRVRAMNARVAELRKQLDKLGGTQENTASGAGTHITETGADPHDQAADVSSGNIGGMPFPTIRNLPMLGAKYGDYYRRAKIQETVFEMLTEQYELAKVEEAKETPSVKVLDPGQVPEKKSFPPRLLVMLLGTFLILSVAIVWVLGTELWRATDTSDPRKILANEVAATLKARAHWFSPNGAAEKDKFSDADLNRPDNLQPPNGESGRP